MKKILALILSLAMLLPIAACEQTPSATTDPAWSETTTGSTTTTEKALSDETTNENTVTPPTPYQPPLFPSDIFKTAKYNPAHDIQYEEALRTQYKNTTTPVILIDKSILEQDADALLAVRVEASKVVGHHKIEAGDLSAYFMRREYETWEIRDGSATCVAMTKEEIENFKGPEDWILLFTWPPKEEILLENPRTIRYGKALEDIPEDQPIYVEIEAYNEFYSLNRVLALFAYYEIELPPQTDYEIDVFDKISTEVWQSVNLVLIEDCGLSQVVEEQHRDLSWYKIQLYLTREQLDALLASELWAYLYISNESEAVPAD
ncbi:MAG: hypothetical protein IJV98_00340 [Clostridia bacterium]|nr:hypothetical protein [Clostridia bacterium]